MAYERKRAELAPCPVELVLGYVGGKWKARILLELSRRAQRFGELQHALPEIAKQVLATQLAALCVDDLACAEPVRHRGQAARRYRLTQKGEALISVLDRVAAWGAAELQRQGVAPPANVR